MSISASELSETDDWTGTRHFAVVGNPNCGKTTIFNALTGLRQKVGNYPGVTVEKKEGSVKIPGKGQTLLLTDLPGLYSLTPRSPDEAIARDVLLGRRSDTPKPEGIINIVDASNLERNLYLTTQLLELGLPMLVVLTMTDVASNEGRFVNEKTLSKSLGVPVTTVIARKRQGLDTLPGNIAALPFAVPEQRIVAYDLPTAVQDECDELRDLVREAEPSKSMSQAYAEAVTLLMTEKIPFEEAKRYPIDVLKHIQADKDRFAADNIDFASVMVESRYGWIEQVTRGAIRTTPTLGRAGLRPAPVWAERADRILLHKVWGYVIFFALMFVVFQAVFTWAQYPMNLIGTGQEALSGVVRHHMHAGPLRDLLVDGVIGGMGTTITFLPQILILFFFLGLLEDTGYLARAAFLMDKLMAKVGLHGKSFIPMLSSFACAIPGIMATRTIDDRKSRLVTILVAPLMSCSARLPVYSLMIGAFILPKWRGLSMICLYMLGTFAAFGMAWLFKKTLLRSAPPRFFIELPPYHMPAAKTVILHMFDRAWQFLKRAGTVILTVSIVLWWLASYPRHMNLPADQRLDSSYAGQMGKAIEPTIKPLGFDWKIGVSLVTSFVAREVFVSSMGTIYAVGDDEKSLRNSLRADPKFSPLLAVCIMIYYVLAMQCLSTVAVVKRETNGWKWPLFQVAYMTVLAWVVTFIVWQVGSALHLGARNTMPQHAERPALSAPAINSKAKA